MDLVSDTSHLTKQTNLLDFIIQANPKLKYHSDPKVSSK